MGNVALRHGQVSALNMSGIMCAQIQRDEAFGFNDTALIFMLLFDPFWFHPQGFGVCFSCASAGRTLSRPDGGVTKHDRRLRSATVLWTRTTPGSWLAETERSHVTPFVGCRCGKKRSNETRVYWAALND